MIEINKKKKQYKREYKNSINYLGCFFHCVFNILVRSVCDFLLSLACMESLRFESSISTLDEKMSSVFGVRVKGVEKGEVGQKRGCGNGVRFARKSAFGIRNYSRAVRTTVLYLNLHLGSENRSFFKYGLIQTYFAIR